MMRKPRSFGYTEGKQNGYAEAVCLMYESSLSIEQIAGIIKMSAERVNRWCVSKKQNQKLNIA